MAASFFFSNLVKRHLSRSKKMHFLLVLFQTMKFVPAQLKSSAPQNAGNFDNPPPLSTLPSMQWLPLVPDTGQIATLASKTLALWSNLPILGSLIDEQRGVYYIPCPGGCNLMCICVDLMATHAWNAKCSRIAQQTSMYSCCYMVFILTLCKNALLI